jgi:hypothetical protein
MRQSNIRMVMVAGVAFAAATAATRTAHAESPWWNPAWDSTTHFLDQGTPTEPSLQSDPLDLRDVAAFRAFVIGNSPEAINNDDSFAWASMVENCAAGFQMINDLSEEFGDRARGRAAMRDVKARLKTWASSKSDTLSVYFPAHLGEYAQDTQAFKLTYIGRPTTDQSRIKFRPTGVMSGNLIATGPQQNPKSIWGQRGFVFCVDPANSKRMLRYASSTNVVLYLDGGSVTSDQRTGIHFPPVRMSLSEAQQYASKFPNRGVIYEVQIRLSPRQGLTDTGGFYKDATVVKIITRNEAGTVLADTSTPPK